MLRRGVLAIALALTELIVGCGGGSSSNNPTGPVLAWRRERRSETNNGTAATSIDANTGIATLLHEFTDVTPSSTSPTLGRDTTAYIPTSTGLLSVDVDGVQRWHIKSCTTDDIGAVDSSPTISFDGRDLIVGGSHAIYRFREPATDTVEGNTKEPDCISSFSSSSASSPLTVVDPADLALLSIITGTSGTDKANPVGRLISIDGGGRRRWSFPADEPFSGGLTSAPAFVGAMVVFTAPNGLLYNLDLSGRLRWSARVGAPYDVPRIPSPAVFLNIYAVSADGDIVAFSPTGRQLWSFFPQAPTAGTVAVSNLATLGGNQLGQSVVFSVDTEGTVYGIGGSDGEPLRFCELTNRACRTSTCPDDGDTGPGRCNETMRCSESGADCKDTPCPNADETCDTRFFCVNAPDQVCGQDFCRVDEAPDGDETSELPESNRCRREAIHPLSTAADDNVVIASAPIVSTDSFVVAATNDGRICARRLDGSVPNGRCEKRNGESGSGQVCSPDSCPEGDFCCEKDDVGCEFGRCAGDPSQWCTADTCSDIEEICDTPWRYGCIDLRAGETDDVAVAVASPVIDTFGNILVTTEKGLAKIE